VRTLHTLLLIRERQHQRIARRKHASRTLRSGLAGLLAVLLVIIAGLIIGFAFTYAGLTKDLPPVDALPVLLDAQNGALMQPTRLYDRTGQTLIYTLENPGISRRYLSLDTSQSESISPVFVEIVVAMQDSNFWQRPGLRWDNLSDSSPQTIPEKLIAGLLLYDELPTLGKSLRLRMLADQAIVRYGRSQVLEWYLNSAYFGHLVYGVDSAARLYLNKPASQLNLAESALLVSIMDTPALNPLDAPAAALERQQETLLLLLDDNLINEQEFLTAMNTPLELSSAAALPTSPALAFSNLVLGQLSTQIERTRIERGGLRIITSLDYALQLQVNCTLQTQLYRLAGQINPIDGCDAARLLPTLPLSESQRNGNQTFSASAVILDPLTAEVLALAGDTTLQGESAVLQSHPAGSLQTPFLALAGFARSLNPASLMWDIPLSAEATPNPDGKYHGPVRLRTALANDYLSPLSQTLLQIGGAPLTSVSRQLGLTGFRTPPDLSETLYTGEPLNPLELAHAYSVFSTLGLLNGQASDLNGDLHPVLVLHVDDLDGQSIQGLATRQTKPVVSAPLAYLVHHVIADEAARWPSLGYPNPLEIGRPAGAKTGQVEDSKSTWIAGYTRQAVALVWLGMETPGERQPTPGIQPAAGLWHALMQYTHRDQPQLTWAMPAGVSQVEVCDPSGLLPTAQCPNIVTEVFLSGNEPVSFDPLYRRFQINRETGRLATVFTPPEMVEERTFLVVPPEAQGWSLLADLPLPPKDFDVVQAPPPNPSAQINAPEQFGYVRGQVELLGTAAGTDFSTYSLQAGQGINPTAWISIGEPTSEPVADGRLGIWDTRGLNGLYVLRLLVVRQDQRVESAIVQVTVDNTSPQASIPYPQPGQEFVRTGQRTITLQANVEDNFAIQRVEWWVNGRKIGERFDPPYALLWQAAVGEQTLEVRVYDLAGNEGRSEEVQFTVR
jgi:membrane peptidoglycan carboxypeptidase